MSTTDHFAPGQTAIKMDLGAIFISMELSRTNWLLTSLSPGGGERLSRHVLRSGDVTGLRTDFPSLGTRFGLGQDRSFQ